MPEPKVFKLIIAGGREFTDYGLLQKKVDVMISEKRHSCTIEIVSGKAKGADTLGEKYAAANNFSLKEFPADWSKGKSAGYERNRAMAEYANACICFWDGKSKGTKHMIDLATAEVSLCGSSITKSKIVRRAGIRPPRLRPVFS